MIRALAALSLLLLGNATRAQPIASAAPTPPEVRSVKMEYAGLVIEFDQSMATWAGDAPALDSIRIEPELDCTWRWNDTNELACATAYRADIPRATEFVVSIAPDLLWSQASVALPLTELRVESDRPEINVRIDTWRDGWPVFEISSWRAGVDTAALQAVLRVETDAGRPLTFELQAASRSRGQINTWRLQTQRLTSSDVHVQVRIRPGLQSTEGPLRGTQDEVLLTALANETFRYRAAGCGDWQHPMSLRCHPGGTLSIELSAPLDEGSLARLRRAAPPGLQPADPFQTLERQLARSTSFATAPGALLQFEVERADTKLRLPLTADLRSLAGETLSNPQQVVAHSGDYYPTLQIAPDSLLVPPGRVKRPAIRGFNLTGGTIEQWSLGDQLIREVDTFGSGQLNRPQHIRPPAPPARVAREGGLVVGTLTHGPGKMGSAYMVAYAPFRVLSAQLGNRWLVWASDWSDGGPISDARIELLTMSADRSTFDVVATGRTARDGIVELVVPESAHSDQADRHLLIRATRGRQRSVLPLEQTLPGSAWGDANLSPVSKPVYLGVTDRPLYRPGEAVRFVLWPRRMSGGRLQSTAIDRLPTVTLHDTWDHDTALASMSLPVADGIASGELLLADTLPDGSYCIGPPASDRWRETQDGACFAVSRFDAAQIWAQLEVERTHVSVDDVLPLQIDSGFFSGGPAIGAEVTVGSLLTPEPLEALYPQHAGYRFATPQKASDDEQIDETIQSQRPVTDRSGRSAPTLRIRTDATAAEAMPSGRLELTADVAYPGQAQATSAARSLIYTRHELYVGLQLDGDLVADEPVSLRGRVVTALGEIDPDAQIEVEIHELDDSGQAYDEPVDPLTTCVLAVDTVSQCSGFRPQQGRAYRFVARSDGAATTRFDRHVWRDTPAPEAAELSLVEQTAEQVHLRLRHPHRRAIVLLSVQNGDRWLRRWTREVVAGDTHIDVAVGADWHAGVTVAATIVALGEGGDDVDPVSATSVAIDIETPTPEPPAITAPAFAEPGESVTVALHNPRATAVHVAISVVDDGLLARAPEFLLDEWDPTRVRLLAQLREGTEALWFGWPRRAPLYSVPADFEDVDSARLERIEVTGSRIKRSDLFEAGDDVDLSRLPDGPARSRFADTAAWSAAIPLAAGATQSLQVELPANLTRWRIITWSIDDSDGLAKSEATITASLPLEARVTAPSRMYVGDVIDLSASGRNRSTRSQSLQLTIAGEQAGTTQLRSVHGDVAADALLTTSLTLVAGRPEPIVASARVEAGDARDAMLRSIDVHPADMPDRRVVVGVVEPDGIELPLPDLPAGSRASELTVQVGGIAGLLRRDWLLGLRDYPHRCWEQTLSRAIGAAAQLAEPAALQWPKAEQEVANIAAAGWSFVTVDDLMQYFDDTGSYDRGSALLTAFTLEADKWLAQHEAQIAPDLTERLREGLTTSWRAHWDIDNEVRVHDRESLAIMAGALAPSDAIKLEHLHSLVKATGDLSAFALSRLVQALAVQFPHSPELEPMLRALRNAGRQTGMRQVIRDHRADDWAMGSRMRDQCGVVQTLARHDSSAEATEAIRRLVAGLLDQYAGGTIADTQASSQCLMALADARARIGNSGDSEVLVTTADRSYTLTLSAAEPTADLQLTAPLRGSDLRIQSSRSEAEPLAWRAQLDFRAPFDAPVPTATGFSIERELAVWRNGGWQTLRDNANAALTPGDWVRITLEIGTPRSLHFIAITDPVPAAWTPESLGLLGRAGVAIHAAASPGSPWFASRRTRDDQVDLYAETLPPGQHQVHYYAEVRHAGRFVVPPARAELMYGSGSFARTGMDRVEVKQ